MRDRVRHVGDAVALVVAETLEQARDAAELVEVGYDALPAVPGIDAADAPGGYRNVVSFRIQPDGRQRLATACIAVFFQRQLLRDLRRKLVDRVCSGSVEPRVKLPGGGQAAGGVGGLGQQHALAAPGQVGGTNQGVLASANDDGVEAVQAALPRCGQSVEA